MEKRRERDWKFGEKDRKKNSDQLDTDPPGRDSVTFSVITTRLNLSFVFIVVTVHTQTNSVLWNSPHVMLLSQLNNLFRACLKTENSARRPDEEVQSLLLCYY